MSRSYTPEQVQAVVAFAGTAAGLTAASQPGMGRGAAANVRAAIQAGKVPGIAKHLSTNKDTVKGLGQRVRDLPRKAGAGVGRGNTYGTAKVPSGKVLVTSNKAVQAQAKASKAKATPKAKPVAAKAPEAAPVAA